MNPDRAPRLGLRHAGAGTALATVQLGAIVPGFLPALLLGLVLAALVTVPLLAVALAVGVLCAPLLAVRRLRRRKG